MDKLFTLLLILSINSILLSQWSVQTSNTAEDLNAMCFVSDLEGYIAGDNGLVLNTSNGGVDWETKNLSTSEKLISIFFINSEIGFVGSESGFLAKTMNGGLTWNELDLKLEGSIEIYFIDEAIGFIGTKNKILRTADQGLSWEEVMLVDVVNFNGIFEIEFVNQQLGYALNQKGILKTNNGGLSWMQWVDNDHPDYNGANILTTMEHIDENLAYYGSPYYLGLYTTNDGGQSFGFQEIELNNLTFKSSEFGFAIEGNIAANIISTNDGGITWKSIFSDEGDIRFSDLVFLDENKGWVIGENGVIMFTDNGGNSNINDFGFEEDAAEIKIYPNPVKAKLQIESDKKIKSLEIFDLHGGRIVQQKTIASDKLEIYLSSLSSGIYLLAISFEDGRTAGQKFIVEK